MGRMRSVLKPWKPNFVADSFDVLLHLCPKLFVSEGSVVGTVNLKLFIREHKIA